MKIYIQDILPFFKGNRYLYKGIEKENIKNYKDYYNTLKYYSKKEVPILAKLSIRNLKFYNYMQFSYNLICIKIILNNL